MRNSLLVMLNRDLFQWMKDLSRDEHFQETIALSDRAIDEQYDMELVLRFVTLRAMPASAFSGLGDVGEFLTEKAKDLARDRSFPRNEEEIAFRQTFSMLNQVLGSDAFRRYDSVRNRFVGGFSISAFEAVALGVGYNHRRLADNPNRTLEIVRNLWSTPDFTDNSGTGVRASTRLPRIIPLGRQIFSP